MTPDLIISPDAAAVVEVLGRISAVLILTLGVQLWSLIIKVMDR